MKYGLLEVFLSRDQHYAMIFGVDNKVKNKKRGKETKIRKIEGEKQTKQRKRQRDREKGRKRKRDTETDK